MQKDPTYLATWKIRIFDKKGQEVQPEQIDWSTDDATNYMFKQDPGDQSSLGIVKINFPSPDGVYMHDTPLKSLFERSVRFESSGCVRTDNIETLVTWILRDTGGWDMQHILAVKQSGEQIDVKLVKQVPVYFTYISAWATPDGLVQFRPDIYNQDGAPETASAY